MFDKPVKAARAVCSRVEMFDRSNFIAKQALMPRKCLINADLSIVKNIYVSALQKNSSISRNLENGQSSELHLYTQIKCFKQFICS